MLGRCWTLVVVVAAIVCAAAPPAGAAKKQPTRQGRTFSELGPTIPVGGVLHGDSSCTVGPTAAFELDDYIDPAGGFDSYYTLITPTDCPMCPTAEPQLRVEVVRLSLEFPVACSQPIVVTFVGTSGPAECPRPNENIVLGGPYFFDIPGQPSPPGTLAYVYALVLPEQVVLTNRAFMGVTFNTWGAGCSPTFPADNPNLVIADSTQCIPCKYYNHYFDGSEINRDDYCTVTRDFRAGPFIHFIDGTCGRFVPVLPSTWGKLKMRYSPRRRRRSIRRPAASPRSTDARPPRRA